MTDRLARQLTDRFYRYLAVSSQSDAHATTLPSTPGQQQMAQLLAEELRALGLQQVEIDAHATLHGQPLEYWLERLEPQGVRRL